jgi:hypothetical protein
MYVHEAVQILSRSSLFQSFVILKMSLKGQEMQVVTIYGMNTDLINKKNDNHCFVCVELQTLHAAVPLNIGVHHQTVKTFTSYELVPPLPVMSNHIISALLPARTSDLSSCQSQEEQPDA